MIELVAHDDVSRLGLAAMLDADKIPYHCVEQARPDERGPLLLGGMALTDADLAVIGRRPVVVLGGGPTFAARTLGVRARVESGPCSVALATPPWSPQAVATAACFGPPLLQLPRAAQCLTDEPVRGMRLAAFAAAGPTPVPAVVQLPECLWCAVDLGAAFATLLADDYPRGADADAGARRRRLAAAAYYAAPELLRRAVRSLLYAARRRRVDAAPALHSRYPVDATGWLLLELLRGVLLRACGRIVRLERWPAPYRAAAAVTHDIEPRRYAYTTGLPRLLSRSQGAAPRPTFGLVADAARRHLRPETRRRLRRADVLCHGLTHRDEPQRGRAAIAAQLRTARATLEGRLRRRVDGYRSPRLDRSPDLLWALDHTGFRYDSSYPDVDRENLGHFGSGVRFNLPYRPLLADDGWRASACLEVPLTAPDCIQPLFTGDSDDDLRTAVSLKAAFVRRSGGLYCALVHAGVFGDRDADRRERHLEYVLQRLRHADTWLASLGEIVEWWCQREALRVTVDGERVAVTNVGAQPIAGVRVVLDGRRGERRRLLPPLTAGQRVLVDFAPDALDRHRAQPA